MSGRSMLQLYRLLQPVQSPCHTLQICTSLVSFGHTETSQLVQLRHLASGALLESRRDAVHDTVRLRDAVKLQQRRRFTGGGDIAKHHHERKLLGYSQQQLYDVVAAVEHYNEFVPWCQRSVIIQKQPPEFIEAELEVGFKMFVERYTSQVYLNEPAKVFSRVSDSTLFDHLDSTWEFKPGPTPSTTWLSYDLDFAFKSPLYRHIASIFFDEVVKRMMNAFEARCKTMYGASAMEKRKMHA